MNNYTYITPVPYLCFLDECSIKEIRIERVLFLSQKKLARNRKKLGIQKKISELNYAEGISKKFLNQFETYAIVQYNKIDKTTRQDFFKLVQNALNILALSELGWSKRRNHSLPLIHGFNDLSKFEFLYIDNEKPYQIPGFSLSGNMTTYTLDSRWEKFHKKLFFFKLLDIINNKKKYKLEKNWYDTIYRCAIFSGKSQASKDLTQAFLWNMMVLEALLTKQGDHYTEILPKRIESFIGWVGYWNTDNYDIKILDLYKKRCALVHDCNSDNLEIEHLLFSDDLILNVFNNIVNHINLFKSKSDILGFSDKVSAEHLLGITGKTRPKTLCAYKRKYDEKDKSMIY